MNHYVDRVCDWNAARYEQILHVDLSHSLLQEELDEFFVAVKDKDHIETLDAIGDIVFVIIGCLWKSGMERKDIKNYLFLVTDDLHKYRKKGLRLLKSMEEQEKISLFIKLFSTLEDMVGVLDAICEGKHKLLPELVAIICDSNETKSLPSEKIDPSVKANINKGEGFVPPTEALKEFEAKYWSMEDESTDTSEE